MKLTALLFLSLVALTACLHQNEEESETPPIPAPEPELKAVITHQSGEPSLYLFYMSDEKQAEGNDGILGTADDRLAFYSKGEYYNSFPDGEFNLSFYSREPLTLTGGIQITSPGNDGLWFTSDDETENFYKSVPISQDYILEMVFSGDDKLPNTSDDFSYNWKYINLTTPPFTLSHISPGPDKLFGTSDDTHQDPYTYFSRAPAGHVTEVTWTQKIGLTRITQTIADVEIDDVITWRSDTPSLFFNGQQEIVSYWQEHYHLNSPLNQFNAAFKTVSYSAGPDKFFRTEDDLVSGYSLHHVDANSTEQTIERYVSYNDAGPDTLWFTNDDPVSSYFIETYSLNHLGHREGNVEYFGSPGPDGVWFTNDDQKNKPDLRLHTIIPR